ncbi:MAG: alpha/beta fold hydrolase [Actinomycetota bacterium]
MGSGRGTIVTRIDAGGISLGYEIRGGGDPLLLIHGLGYGRWGWHWQVPALSAQFRVIAFDNRGIGESDAPPGPYTVAQMAGDAAALLDALGIRRAHVIGTSLGGFIAQTLAVERPDLVDRLVLACTGLGGPRYVPMPEVTVRLLAELPSLPSEERLGRATRNAFTAGFVRQRPDVINQILEFRTAEDQPYEQWGWQAAAGAAFDLSDRVGTIRSETLVITGVEDTVVDLKNSRLLAEEIPNARLVEMAGGHLFFIEEADTFNRIVASFLAGV